MLSGIIFGSIGFSTLVQLFKNRIAKNAIERKGCVINPDNRSASEQISSFLKDYFYIIVPVYNIVKAVKLFAMDDIKYTQLRKSKLDLYERLSTAPANNTQETTPAQVRTPQRVQEPAQVRTPQRVPEPAQVRAPQRAPAPMPSRVQTLEEEISMIIDNVNLSNDRNFLTNINQKYYNLSLEYRDKYHAEKQRGADVNTLNNIVRRIKLYDKTFIAARDKLRQLNSQKRLSL